MINKNEEKKSEPEPIREIKEKLERIQKCNEAIFDLSPGDTKNSLQICNRCGQIEELVNIICGQIEELVNIICW